MRYRTKERIKNISFFGGLTLALTASLYCLITNYITPIPCQPYSNSKQEIIPTTQITRKQDPCSPLEQATNIPPQIQQESPKTTSYLQ